MFSDLVGSTALSARMDPEDLRELISAYQKCVAEAVQRFGGFVAKYMGDRALIYFGYPQAYEDDADQAVRAGLELVAAVGALKTHAALQTRVGIATGDLIGSGASQEQARFSDQGAMWSNEIEKKNRAGYAKSCGADFYDMPELNGCRIPRKNDVSKARKFWERRHQAVPGAFAAVPCLALGLNCGPDFSI
jgi:Adenylate and Guanylate cyclase catalytic domain